MEVDLFIIIVSIAVSFILGSIIVFCMPLVCNVFSIWIFNKKLARKLRRFRNESYK
jgi:hypothetical protein